MWPTTCECCKWCKDEPCFIVRRKLKFLGFTFYKILAVCGGCNLASKDLILCRANQV